MASPSTTITYTGLGKAGTWADPHNWAGLVVPNAADTAIFTTSAALNGPIEVQNLMLLGAETITISGQVKTDSGNQCQSFMACDGAVVTFTAGSSLLDAGGFITGIDADATVNAAGASGSLAASHLSVNDIKLGQASDGSGTLNLAGTLNVKQVAIVGEAGLGALNVSGSGSASLSNLTLGLDTGATGAVSLTGNAHVSVAGVTTIGTSIAGAPGGVGTLTLAGQSTLSSADGLFVSDGSSVVMQGGALVAGASGDGLNLRPGADIAGYGTITSTTQNIVDNAVITASGGTLVVTGQLNGMGTAQIAAGSTLDLVSSRIAGPTLAFIGGNATLDLVTGVAGTFNITGFAAGDSIVMANITAANWNGASDVLTLSENGQAMDRLHLSGVAANASFTVTAGAHGSIISLAAAAPQSNAFTLALHH